MWYVLTFIVGACLGGAGIGWIAWNKMDAIKAELARAKSFGQAL